jgi:hypothetical protein
MMDFFTTEEVELHKSLSKTALNPAYKEAMDKLLKKVDVWSKRCKNLSFDSHPKLERDSGKNMQTSYNHSSVHAHYFWRRLYPHGAKTNQVFFQVSVGLKEEDGLITQIGYNYDDRFSTLNELQKNEMKRLKREHPEWSDRVPTEEINQWDWKRLTNASYAFIQKYYKDYLAVQEHIVSLGNGGNVEFTAPSRKERENNNPSQYFALNEHLKLIGNAGERFVIDHIKNSLKAKGVGEPEIFNVLEGNGVKDGDGYDIRYKDEKGIERYIEVKTTTGAYNMPFYFTGPELEAAQLLEDKYLIYRVYDFKMDSGEGELIPISLEQTQKEFDFKPIAYSCQPK